MSHCQNCGTQTSQILIVATSNSRTMIIPPLIFAAFHIVLVASLGTTFPEKFRAPLFLFAVLQIMYEHYAEKFPSVAMIGPVLFPLAIALLIMHYYYAFQLISDKKIVWSSLAIFFVVFGGSKALDFGSPKDTIEEQIEALKDDTYNMQHLLNHCIVMIPSTLIVFSLPKDGAQRKKGCMKFLLPLG